MHEPHRADWLSTHRTDSGSAIPPKYRSESDTARSNSSSSLGLRRASARSTRATMVSTHSASSARVNVAGTSTMMRSPSR